MYLGTYIKQQRLRLDKTGQELADEVITSRTYISFIETLHVIPTPDLVTRIAKALNTDPEWLIRVAATDEIGKAVKRINAKFGIAQALDLNRKEPMAGPEAKNIEVLKEMSKNLTDILGPAFEEIQPPQKEVK